MLRSVLRRGNIRGTLPKPGEARRRCSRTLPTARPQTRTAHFTNIWAVRCRPSIRLIRKLMIFFLPNFETAGNDVATSNKNRQFLEWGTSGSTVRVKRSKAMRAHIFDDLAPSTDSQKMDLKTCSSPMIM